MKLTIITVLAALCLLPAAAFGVIVITEDTTWRAEDSPIVLAEEVRIRLGATLTIEPGVEVVVDGVYKIWNPDGGEGGIVAEGTPADSIIFRSAAATPTSTDWTGIILDDPVLSSFKHCVFMHADKALDFLETDTPVENCSFRRCKIGLYLRGANPPVTSCSFGACDYTAIYLMGPESSPTIRDCNITVGDFNAAAAPYNVFCANYYSLPSRYVDARYNWWGSSDENEISRTIFDETFSPQEVTVDFGEWYTEPGVETSSWGVIKAMFID